MTVHPLVGRVQSEADQVDLKRVVIWILIALPLTLGWMAAKSVLTVRFVLAAIKVGYKEGLKTSRGSG